MKRLSRTRLFLLEMLVNLLIFVVGATVCFATLSEAYSLSAFSRVLTKAHIATENATMAFRATNGDITTMPDILNCTLINSNKMQIWYDKNWNVCSKENGIYLLEITTSEDKHNIINGNFNVYEPNGDSILELSICQYKNEV